MPIHSTALVSAKAELDGTVEVGPYAVIEEGVRVGPRTRIGPHAYLATGTELGADNEVHMGAVLGHEPQDLRYRRGTRSFLRVGDRNVFREYCTVHRGTEPDSTTVIGHECYLMAQSHVGHNCRLGNHVIVCNCALLAGYVEVGDRAFVSGGVVIHQFVRVGRLAMFSGNARVSMDVPPFVIAAERNEIHALNQVGLKRAGISAEAMREIKALFRLFYRSDLTTGEALRQAGGFATSEAKEFVAFVQNAPNGLCPPARRRAA